MVVKPYSVKFASGKVLHLYARSRTHAIETAAELIPGDAVKGVYQEGDW